MRSAYLYTIICALVLCLSVHGVQGVKTVEEYETLLASVSENQPVCVFYDVPFVNSPMHGEWRKIWKKFSAGTNEEFNFVKFDSFDCGTNSGYARDTIKVHVLPSVRCHWIDSTASDAEAETTAEEGEEAEEKKPRLHHEDVTGVADSTKILKLLRAASGRVLPTTVKEVVSWVQQAQAQPSGDSGDDKKAAQVVGVCRPASACPELRALLRPIADGFSRHSISFSTLATDFGDSQFRQLASKYKINRFPTVIYIENGVVRNVRALPKSRGGPGSESDPTSADLALFVAESYAHIGTASSDGTIYTWTDDGERNDDVSEEDGGRTVSRYLSISENAGFLLPVNRSRIAEYLLSEDSEIWHSLILLSREQYVAKTTLVSGDDSAGDSAEPVTVYAMFDIEDEAWRNETVLGEGEEGPVELVPLYVNPRLSQNHTIPLRIRHDHQVYLGEQSASSIAEFSAQQLAQHHEAVLVAEAEAAEAAELAAKEEAEAARLKAEQERPQFKGLTQVDRRVWRKWYTETAEQHLLTFYVRESCHYCDHMVDDFTALAKDIVLDSELSSLVNVAMVNCSVTPYACELFPIATYPAVYMLRHKPAPNPDCPLTSARAGPVMYEGALTRDSILRFAREHSKPWVPSRAPQASKGLDTVTVSPAFSSDSNDCELPAACLSVLQERFYQSVTFELGDDASTADSVDRDGCVASLVLTRQPDDFDKVIYPDTDRKSTDSEEHKSSPASSVLDLVVHDVLRYSRPFMEEFMSYTMRTDPTNPVPVALAIVHSERPKDKDYKTIMGAFRDVAAGYYDAGVVFCTIDAKTYWRFTSSLQDPDRVARAPTAKKATGIADGINPDGSPDLTEPSAQATDFQADETFPRVVMLAGYGYSRVAYPGPALDFAKEADLRFFVNDILSDPESKTKPLRGN